MKNIGESIVSYGMKQTVKKQKENVKEKMRKEIFWNIQGKQDDRCVDWQREREREREKKCECL